MFPSSPLVRTAGRIARRAELAPFVPAFLLAALAPGAEAAPIVASMFLASAVVLWRSAAQPGPGAPRREGLPPLEDLAAALDDALTAAPRTGRSTVVFAIGIDGLAASEAAEPLRREVAHRLRGALREGDRLARLDGSTFAVMLAPILRADLDVAVQVAARLQAAVADPLLPGAAGRPVSCSVGFCLGSRAPRPAGATALAAAAEALAEARAAGAASISAFVPGRPPPAGRRAALDKRVVAALEAGEIRPWFQPQIACGSGVVSGVEALARWEHPERGVIGPAAFLPVLEAAGLLDRLGRVVLTGGLAALAEWERAGCAVPKLGINFSAQELRDPHLADRIGRELERFDIAPERLAVEILETVVAGRDDDGLRRTVADLSRLGCTVDLDDFGTGSASIAALARFAVSRIKIDRSFVAGIDRDPGRQRMAGAIIGLAQRLELDTLAEGVERVGEHAALAALGCGHVQGFAIARPMPAAEAAAWMRRHAARLARPATQARRTR